MNLSTFKQIKDEHSHAIVVQDDATLHLLQQVVLSIFDDIASFCEQNDISYVLSGGSVLGAVRHGGFIPWDDDMDINMPRKDYNRFIRLFPAAYAHKYDVQSPELTPQAGIPTTRVRLRGTTMRMHDDCAVSEQGIFVDIFPIENTFNNPLARNLHGVACLATGLMYSCRRMFRDRAAYLALADNNPQLSRVIRVKATIGVPTALLSMERWSKIIVGMYSLCKNDNSTMVAVPAGRDHYFGELCRRDQFCKTREASFEGRTVRIPFDAEGYLTMHYGDWQRIPPADEREHHSYLELDFGAYAPDGEGARN